MKTNGSSSEGQFLHVVTLDCKSEAEAQQCMVALAEHGRPDALAGNCVAYEFGLKEGSPDTVYIVERWNCWHDLDAVIQAAVVPALPMYNAFLKRSFDPARDTLRIRLSV